MARKAKHPCGHPGCVKLISSGGLCDEHLAPVLARRNRRIDGKRPSSSRRGYGWRWRKLRNAYLESNPVCAICERDGYTKAATEVDHIVPLRAGGSNAKSNLQSLCKTCHSRKTAGELGWTGRPRVSR